MAALSNKTDSREAFAVHEAGNKQERLVMLHGSCLCGGVAFAVDPPFDRFVHCHCSRCRKASGTAHATNAAVKPSAFRWLQGQELVARYEGR